MVVHGRDQGALADELRDRLPGVREGSPPNRPPTGGLPRRCWSSATLTMGVNYGLNTLRFPSPVPVGSKLRLTATLKDVEEVAGGLQLTVAAVIEAEGIVKQVCIAEPVFRFLG